MLWCIIASEDSLLKRISCLPFIFYFFFLATLAPYLTTTASSASVLFLEGGTVGLEFELRALNLQSRGYTALSHTSSPF
jgi:hypothetical protein